MRASRTRPWATRSTGKSSACSRGASQSEEVEFSIRAGNIAKQRTGCIVVGVYEGRKLSPPAVELDTASRHVLDGIVKRDFEGELETTLLLQHVPHLGSARVLLVGLGP